jgi:hypothetical protein
MKTFLRYISILVIVSISILGLLGWCMSVIKLVRSDFDAPYKAEILYGIGTFTGAGAVIGWFNIED